jgi:hypothetical protein
MAEEEADDTKNEDERVADHAGLRVTNHIWSLDDAWSEQMD